VDTIRFSTELAEVLALGSAFTWALNGLVLRSQTGAMSASALNALRCGSAAIPFLVLLPFDQPLGSLLAVPWPEWGMLGGSLVVGPLIGATLYIVALKEIGVSRAMALSGTYPLSTLVLDHLLFGQPLSPQLAVGAGLVVCGVVFLASQSHQASARQPSGRVQLGVALALAASILWGLSTVLLRPAMAHLSIIQTNAIRMPLVAIILYTCRVLPSGERPWRAPPRALLAVTAVGIISQGFGNYMFLAALATLGASRTVTLASVYPVFGLGLAVLFLGEQVTLRVLLGVGCCLAGVLVVL